MARSQHQQLELWNDTPEPWRKRMEDDAFRIAFPDEERAEGDVVTVFMSYAEERDGHRWSSWTWESGHPSQFTIEVRWSRPYQKVSRFNPRNARGRGLEPIVQRYEKKDALKFWLELMRMGAK